MVRKLLCPQDPFSAPSCPPVVALAQGRNRQRHIPGGNLSTKFQQPAMQVLGCPIGILGHNALSSSPNLLKPQCSLSKQKLGCHIPLSFQPMLSPADSAICQLCPALSSPSPGTEKYELPRPLQ